MADPVAHIPGYDLPALLEQEASAIAERRQQAFILPPTERSPQPPLPPRYVEQAGQAEPAPADPNAAHWPLPGDLVGLALSGGGLRSAAFNLGFIQALSRFGLFRYVDYMCSVSGGGYVAGHVTAAASTVERFHDQPEARFGVDANQRLLPAAYRFRHLGEYLLNYASFLWRYVASTLATLLLFVSLLGILACLVALVWRSHDLPTVRQYCDITGISQLAGQMRISGETLSAFIPSIPLLFIFLLLALVRRIAFQHRRPAWLDEGGEPDPAFRPEPHLFLVKHVSCLLIGMLLLLAVAPWLVLHVIQASITDSIKLIGMTVVGVAVVYGAARVWLIVLRMFDGSVVHGALWTWLASIAISIAVFMGNGVSGLFSGSPEYNVQSYWSWFYAISAIVSFLPIVAAGQLARSGQNDAPRWKRTAFYVLVGAATIGFPMAIIHLVARENIAGYATHRASDLLPEDILDWNTFLEMLDGTDEGTEGKTGKSERPLAFLGITVKDDELLSGVKLNETAAELQGANSWDRYRNSPAVRPLMGTGHFLGIHNPARDKNVFTYLSETEALRKSREDFLKPVNQKLFGSANATFTAELMKLVVLQTRKELAKRNDNADDSQRGGKDASTPAQQPDGALPPGTKGTDPSEKSPPANQLATAAERQAVETHVKERAAKMLEGSQFVAMWNRATLQSTDETNAFTDTLRDFELTTEQRAVFHRLLLEFLYKDVIRERQMVSTLIVPVADQWYRGGWLLMWTVLFVLALTVDYNRWSPFYSYYRERLARYFVAVFGDSRLHLPLHEFKTWKNGGPVPLLLGSHFLFCRVRPEARPVDAGSPATPASPWPTDPALASDASSVHPLVFSPLYCGGPAAGYQQTENYCGKQLTLADAMAISGSALTPFMVDNIFFCALMAAFNLRIGQWLPRPGHALVKANLAARGYEIAWEIWQGCFNVDRYQKDWRLTLAADGGFHDFFGLEELLLRRCRVIILSDAGCNNGQYEFGALADVIRMVRERHGIQVLDLDNECPADLSILRRDKTKNVQPMHHICLRIAYPPGAEGGEPTLGLLVYAQMSLTGREPLDLQQFRNSHPDFPDEPITNQFFDPKQVESYRQLGYHVGSALCSQVRPWTHEQGQRRFADLSDISRALVRGYLTERVAFGEPKPLDEKDNEVRVMTGGIDLFECSRQWCPEPPSLAVEEYVSEQISAYLSDALITIPALDEVRQRLAEPAEANLGHLLVRHAIKLLKIHRSMIGYPTKSPYRPGGRRAMIRALTTAAIFKQVQAENQAIHQYVERLNPSPYAWCALAHLVFQKAGVETLGRYLAEFHELAEETRLQPETQQRIDAINAALRQGNVADLAKLLQPPPPPSPDTVVNRRRKGH